MGVAYLTFMMVNFGFQSQPVTDVYIEIQSRFIQLYSAKFLIHAHFSGIRYIMFQWPILSAAIGERFNGFCVLPGLISQ